MPNTNFQTFHQMGQAINEVVRQATGRDAVQNIDMDHVTVAQNHYYEEVTLSAGRVSFTDRVGNTPLEKCVVQIEPVQEGSGDPSPSNVRPITGWTGVKVTRTGKNLCDINNTVGSTSFKGAQINLFAGTILYVQRVGGVRSILYGIRSDGTYFSIGNIEDTKTTMTLAENAVGIGVSEGASANYHPGDYLCVSLTDFDSPEPYNGESYNISFLAEAGTVYGGTLDVINGVLTVDRVLILVRDVTSITKSNTNFSNWRINLSGGLIPLFNRTDVLVISSHYKGLSYNDASTTGDKYVFLADANRISIKDTVTSGLTVEEYKSQYGDVQFVYYLATPLTYQLTPQQITTLLGTNTIWADTGDIEVKVKLLKELY